MITPVSRRRTARRSPLLALVLASAAASNAACTLAEEEYVSSSESAQRIKPSHLDPNKIASVEVRLPLHAAALADVSLAVRGVTTPFATPAYFEGPTDVELELCYGNARTLCARQRVALRPKEDVVVDLGGVTVLVPDKEPPPPPPPKPDFGPKGYGTPPAPSYWPRLVRLDTTANATESIVPVGAKDMLPHVAEALGAGGPAHSWVLPVLAGTYRFGAAGFQGSGERIVYQDVHVAPGSVATVHIARNTVFPSRPWHIHVEPPVRELPDAIAQRYDLVIASRSTWEFPSGDTNAWGEHHDPLVVREVPSPMGARTVVRSLSRSTAAPSETHVYKLRPLFPPPRYDGAYHFVLNATQTVELNLAASRPTIGRIDVDDAEVIHEQSGARATVPGTWRLLDERRRPVYGAATFATSRGIDALAGKYIVEVSFVSPWTGPQTKDYAVTVP